MQDALLDHLNELNPPSDFRSAAGFSFEFELLRGEDELDRLQVEAGCQSVLERCVERKILLRVVKHDSERCLINASAGRTIAFLGDAVDAPTLCCGHCVAELVVGIDRGLLGNMVIECKRCGCFNETREPNAGTPAMADDREELG